MKQMKRKVTNLNKPSQQVKRKTPMRTLIPYESDRWVNDVHSLMNTLWNRGLFDWDMEKVASQHWLPAIDVKEEQNQFLITVDLPGVDTKNIEIALDNNLLTIQGKRDEKKEEQKGAYYRTERKQGYFCRQLTLPQLVKSEGITAKSKQGILTITIPKDSKSTSKKIDIQEE